MEKLQNFRGTPNQNTVLNFFKRIGRLCKTITFDNIKGGATFRFTNHQEIAKEIGVKIYFANPYHSWEKGVIAVANRENTNGLYAIYSKKIEF